MMFYRSVLNDRFAFFNAKPGTTDRNGQMDMETMEDEIRIGTKILWNEIRKMFVEKRRVYFNGDGKAQREREEQGKTREIDTERQR